MNGPSVLVTGAGGYLGSQLVAALAAGRIKVSRVVAADVREVPAGRRLAGIESVQAAMPRRLRAWQDLAALLDRDKLKLATQVEPLARVPELAKDILAGKVQGRVVIDVNA